jgi:transposase-like protein
LGYAKNRLVKFKGMDKSMFNLHLKECEFRFNNRLTCLDPKIFFKYFT